MANDLVITVTAKDGTQRVFKEIAQDAKSMGDSTAKAGKQAAKGLNEIDSAAKKSQGSWSKLRNESTLFGAALGGVATGLIGLGASFREQERLTDAVRRAYGDAGDEMIEFSNHLQDTTRFSNDAVQAALLYGTSLVSNYGLAADQIKQLTETAADMAQMFGISLPDAMSRLTSAIRGEGEAAELLGLNMSDAAVSAAALQAGIVGWNVPGALSEAEKAAFRFDLMMQQTASSSGAAAAAAEGVGGKFRQIINDVQDLGQGFGGMLGVVGEVAAEFQGIALWAPVAGGAIGKLSDAAKRNGTSLGALAISAAKFLGPLALLAAAAGAAYFAYNKLTEGNRNLAESYKELNDVIDHLNETGFENRATQLQNLKSELINVAGAGNAAADAMDRARFTDFSDGGAREVWLANEKAYEDMIAAMDSSPEILEAANNKINAAFTTANINIDAFLAEVARLRAEMSRNPSDEFGEDWFLTQVGNIDLSNFTEEATKVIASTGEVVLSLEALGDAFGDVNDLALDVEFKGMESAAADILNLSDALLSINGPISGSVMAYGDLAKAGTLTADSLTKAAYAQDKLNEALASGDFDNVAIMEEVFRIMSDPSLDPNEKADALFNYAASLASIKAAGDGVAVVLEAAAAGFANIGTEANAGAIGVAAMAGAASLAEDATAALADEQERAAARQDAYNQAMIDFVGNGDNILAFLSDFLKSNEALGRNIEDNKRIINDFGRTFMIAFNTDKIAGDIDYLVETVFGAVDEIESRLGSMTSITDALFGGDAYDGVGPLVDALNAGVLSVEDFNAAVQAGIAIEDSAAQSALYLTEIRAKQLPLLEDQAKAYEDNLRLIGEMGPAEAQRALYLQSSAGQTAIATQYATAYSASLGEIPPEVATDMIVSAAEADPILKDLLLQMGLIEEGAEGTITVNFPDGPTVQDTITELTKSVDALIETLGDIPPLHIETDDSAIDATTQKLADIGDEPIIGNVELALDQPTYAAVNQSLTDMENDPVTIPVTFDASGLGGGAANAVLGLAGQAAADVTVSVDADTSAADDAISAVESRLSAINGRTSVIQVDGDNGDALQSIQVAEQTLQNISGDSATVVVRGDNDNALNAIREAERQLNNIDGNRATIRILADTSDARDGIAWARSYDGDTLANTYVNTYHRDFFSSFFGNRHGGIAGYAGGGVISELAEAGPELVHFANGGVGVAATRGLYNLTPGDMVSPAPASASALSGMGNISVPIIIQGNVYGEEDMLSRISQRLAPVLESAIQNGRRGQGRI